MKKLFVICLFFTAAAVFAQTETEDKATVTEHFVIYADQGDAEIFALQMEMRFTIYSGIFRFDSAAAASSLLEAAANSSDNSNTDNVNLGALPMKVRVYRNREQYELRAALHLDTAVQPDISSPEDLPSAIYFHYNKPEQRELIVYLDGMGASPALPYQAFIQYLKAFIPNPPAWIQDGFAVVFSGMNFDSDNGEMIYEENTGWLAAVKSMKEPLLPEIIMREDMAEKAEHFQGQAWTLVSFFLTSGREGYMRSLTESFMLLSSEKTAEENAVAVIKRITAWNNMEELTVDYHEYLSARKTWTSVLSEGERAYTEGRTEAAKTAFLEAAQIQPEHYAPWYYLGLLAYDAGRNEEAGEYYHKALNYGAAPAAVLYALGVNAAVSGKSNEAIEYLRGSARADPDRYQEKSENLIAQFGYGEEL